MNLSGMPIEPLESRRLWAAGALDPFFGVAGRVVIGDGGGAAEEAIRDIVPMPDGRVVGIGVAVNDSMLAATVRLMRFNTDGSPDSTFVSGGMLEAAMVSATAHHCCFKH